MWRVNHLPLQDEKCCFVFLVTINTWNLVLLTSWTPWTCSVAMFLTPSPLSHNTRVTFRLLPWGFTHCWLGWSLPDTQHQWGFNSVSVAVFPCWLISVDGFLTKDFFFPLWRRKAESCALCQQCLCNYSLCQIGPAEVTLSTHSGYTLNSKTTEKKIKTDPAKKIHINTVHLFKGIVHR